MGRGLADRWLVAKWRRRHRPEDGSRVNATIHDDDEMFWTISEIDPAAPVAHYLDSGSRAADALVDALQQAGRDLEGPLLDFACGHGRVTRHLVGRVDLTVADIHPGAVEFVTDTFGVPGFVSVTDPADLDHGGRYRVIWVASLFSHLSHDRWVPWLAALRGLLDDDGALVFSTNGPGHHDLPEVEPGFRFGTENETHGRLDGAEYGTTEVDPEWVERAAASVGGRVLCRLPDRLWGVQDLYVVG
jgi:hypothetical protein